MEVGDEVEVFSAFEGTCESGFEVTELVAQGYRVRRMFDGLLLPGYTSESELRPASPAHCGTCQGL